MFHRHKAAAPNGALESPGADGVLYDQAIILSGWVCAHGGSLSGAKVRAYLDEDQLTETALLFSRPDIEQEDAKGFRMLGRIHPPLTEPREAMLRVAISCGGDSHTIAEQRIRILPSQLSERPYGETLYPQNATLLHRENIYGSGPPLEEPGSEVADLLRTYLPAGASVVDVGCGAGAYGPGLIAAGHRWLGLESSDACCAILQRRDLPFRHVDLAAQALPCRDREWDCAICIEVLEHVLDAENFVREIARITRGRVLFSVPNLELIPYLYDWRVVPWHLLEADHRNFFTRGSLRALLERHFRRVEIFPYGEHPLRTREGVALYVHFFAVANRD